MIDLRSDTVTKPTPEMRRAIANAEVGDDVIDVDPTVDRLQRATAEILGKEAAIFMPSGTMTNQTAVRIHCRPGDELLCESGCHIYHYEQDGIDENGMARGKFVATGVRPNFMDRLESAGVRLPASAFRQRVMLVD